MTKVHYEKSSPWTVVAIISKHNKLRDVYERGKSSEIFNWGLYYFHGLNDDFHFASVGALLGKKQIKIIILA